MAQGIGNFIDRIQLGTDEANQIAIGSSAYGVCNTIASEAAKTVNIPGFTLNTGTTVHIKFNNTNSATSPTLNISSTGAKPIMQYGTTNAGVNEETTGWQAGAVLTLTYDGTNWIRDQGYNTHPTIVDLGLSNAMHFIGVVASDSPNTPSDGTNSIPKITNLLSYTPAAGDVIIDKYSLREYVWANGAWVLLGFTTSTTYDSNGETASTSTTTASNPDIPTWISRITQATDGTITTERQTLGIIPVEKGGTGVTSFTNDCVIVSTGNATQSLVSRALKVTEDNSSNLIITNNVTNKNITLETNGSGTLDINSTTGALTISSDTGKLTISSDYGSLVLEGGAQNTIIQSILTLGNSTAKTSANQSEGKIVLYSTGSEAHILIGENTSTTYTHTLPNETGYLVSADSNGIATGGKTIMYVASTGLATASNQTEGGPTQPIYLNAGTLTALTYTANRLYYSASTTSFAETHHFATDTELVLNAPNGTNAITTGYILEVNGKTKLKDNLDITGNITVTGNILPATDNLYSLGRGGDSNQLRWKEVFIGSENTYGGPYQPIYWNNGVPSPLTFEPNRLYYSAAAASGQLTSTQFLPSGHYASSGKIGIDIITWPTDTNNQAIPEVLYVNGDSIFNGIVKIINSTDITSGANATQGALVVSGGATIGAKLAVGNAATFASTVSVANSITIEDTANNSGSSIVLDNTGYINIENGNSSILLSTVDNNGSSIGEFTITDTLPTITLAPPSGASSSFYTTWTITNNQKVFTITNNDDTSLIGDDNGWQLYSRVGINTIYDSANSGDIHILTINGSTLIVTDGANNSNISVAHLDIVTDSNSAKVLEFKPNTSGCGFIGTSTQRWAEIYATNILSISDTTSSFEVTINDGSNTSVASAVLTGVTPLIELHSSDNIDHWIMKNDEGLFTLTNSISNSLQYFYGNVNGFYLSSHLYISDTISLNPSLPTNTYNLYIDGTTYHTGHVTFSEATSSTDSPKLEWSGGSDTASIYYKVDTGGILTIDTYDSSCLIGFASNAIDKVYMDTATPSFYPASTGTGSLGLGGNSPKRWGSVYIGSEDKYGDAYTPIYWNNGVPAVVTPVQYVSFTIGSGKTGVILQHNAFNEDSYVLQIVITSGESNLNSTIEWSSSVVNSNGQILLTCAQTSGIVSGYILVARGDELSSVVSYDVSPSI